MKKVRTARTSHKYIFVVGGVMSGVGKGITASSIGKILQGEGFKVNVIKIDPYLNVDAGTMNPTEHGEVFVLRSGLETDQDMGNYERFMDMNMRPEDYMTSGMVYKSVIDRERNLGYGGKCVEAIPHITSEIRHRIENAAKVNRSEISLIEIGGTVGDYQNALFFEAARFLKLKNPRDVIFLLVSYLPLPSTIGEMKTKPTQNAVRQLNSYGIQPDIIVARAHVPLDAKRKEKIAISCSVPPENVISAPDIDSVYDVPINFERDKIGQTLLRSLSLEPRQDKPGIADWRAFVSKIKKASAVSANESGTSKVRQLKIAVVGKYFDSGDFVFSDAYVSVIEAIKYSAYYAGVKPKLEWINSKDFETGKLKIEMLADFQGVLVPGGFGQSGIEGILAAIRFARENNIPYFGLCYGMQLMCIEYARNVLGLRGAHTAEVDPKTAHKIIDIMPDQRRKIAAGNYGASMRLGVYPCVLKGGTVAQEAYTVAGPNAAVPGSIERAMEETTTSAAKGTKSKGGKIKKQKQNALKSVTKVEERHRHRYEVNPDYIARLEKAGLVFSGVSPDGTLMEIAELSAGKSGNGTGTGIARHPFFLGTQFHPEFHARPLHPHPLFDAFVKAAVARQARAEKADEAQ